ncbi:hypothetical protein NBT05_12430 [Aquimarina sp. ERC-38]|uniref:DUF6731 family protein n=1 Tax=Aquimarina sp. ERC-38 TaxID=2949996 RepID=UPI002245D741|nr:DUF6731 family protein [Aquimarina sp. ERC-38]UZO79755.1 hypothetical protein NBT05_12430 [Aquimarina sp. ERC-38]
MTKKYKENNVYYYQIKPHLINPKTQDIKKVKKKFKKAFKFKGKVDSIKQGVEGSVSATSGKVYNNRYIGGALIYTQETNIPPKMDETGTKPQVLDLSGFKGLGYDSAYFYDVETMVFAFESRVPGVTLSSLQTLIYRNQEIDTFDFKPIASSNAYEEFLESQGVTSLEMDVVSVDNKKKKNSSTPAISEALNLLDEANGEKITISVTSGRTKKKYLDKNYLKKLANDALSSMGYEKEFTSFKLKIEDVDSGKIVPIDLITGRIRDKTKIEKVKAINEFSIKSKIKQLEGLYLKRREAIEVQIKL